MTLLDGKYTVVQDLGSQGFLRTHRVRSSETQGTLYWFEVHTPEARSAFHRYRNALKRLETLGATPHGLEISAKPGRYYVFWPDLTAPTPGRSPKRARLGPWLEALSPFGYGEKDLRVGDQDGKPVLADLNPLAGLAGFSKASLNKPGPARPESPRPPPPAGRTVINPEPAPAPPAGKPARAPGPAPRPEPRRYRLNWPAWVPGLVFMLLGGLALFLGAERYLNPPQHILPDLHGKTPRQAVEAVRGMGLRVEFVEGNDQSQPKETILEQSPEAGSIVKPGRRLELVLNRPKLGSVPTLVGRPLEDAQRALEAAGYVVGPVSRVSAEATAGTVLASLPATGTELRQGEAVRLLVSTGARPPLDTILPDLTGLTLEEAEYLLNIAELQTQVFRVASGAPEGQVLSQQPDPGTLMNKNAVVRLTVATQPDVSLPQNSPFAPPTPQPQPTPEPTPTPQAGVRNVPLSITLPSNQESAQVRLTVDDANPPTRVLYEGPFPPGGLIEVAGGVAVQGNATFRLYVNGELYQEWTNP
ncbi:MAG TPA: PASTA domain-containing protein [Meiothermus sp.]|nr:PASTA domain-containing protein [Meiothermus sp.]